MGRQHWPQGCLDYGCYELIIKFCKYNLWGTCKLKQNSKSKHLLNVCVLVAMRRLNLKPYCRHVQDVLLFPFKPWCWHVLGASIRPCAVVAIRIEWSDMWILTIDRSVHVVVTVNASWRILLWWSHFLFDWLSSATFDCELIIVKSIDVELIPGVGIRLIYVMRCLRNANAR